jgi:hypothetical protein
LKGFALPVGKTPLFVGGEGVVVLRELPGKSLAAVVYPIAPRGTSFRFTHRDGTTRSTIEVANSRWKNVRVMDATDDKSIAFQREEKTGAIRFAIAPGHNYRIQD